VRRVVRRITLDQPAARVFAACLDLLRTPDPARGVVSRRVEPDPPRVDAVVHTIVRDRRGERELRATVVELREPELLGTVTEGMPAVRTEIRCEPVADGARTLVTLSSDAEGTLSAFGRAGVLLDLLLFAGGQRRAARATLRRLAELAARD
jgi:Polyketide cyclase / dehydrase and lipid transport